MLLRVLFDFEKEILFDLCDSSTPKWGNDFPCRVFADTMSVKIIIVFIVQIYNKT
jgi:hypothetical protein